MHLVPHYEKSVILHFFHINKYTRNLSLKVQYLVNKFISDVVLQVLSFVSENEIVNIKEKQAEGIRIAKEKSVKFGKPKISTPLNINEILDKYKGLTNIEATKLIRISRETFFRLVKERKSLKNSMPLLY